MARVFSFAGFVDELASPGEVVEDEAAACDLSSANTIFNTTNLITT